MIDNLVPAPGNVKVGRFGGECVVQRGHGEEDDGEAPEAFEADGLLWREGGVSLGREDGWMDGGGTYERLDLVYREDFLFDDLEMGKGACSDAYGFPRLGDNRGAPYKLRCREYLGARDEQHADKHPRRILGRDHLGRRHRHPPDQLRHQPTFPQPCLLGLLHHASRQPDERDTQHDEHQARPLVPPQPPSQEDNTEDADPEDERASRHLVDGDGREDEADVHERCSGNVARSGEEEEAAREGRHGEVAGRKEGFVWRGWGVFGIALRVVDSVFVLRNGRVNEGGFVCRSVAETGEPWFEEEGNHAHEFANEHAGVPEE